MLRFHPQPEETFPTSQTSEACKTTQLAREAEGQAIHLLPHKATPTFFLHAKLIPMSQIFRKHEIYKNFTRNRR